MTLRWRLALVFAGATAVVLLVSGLILLKVLQHHRGRTREHQGEPPTERHAGSVLGWAQPVS